MRALPALALALLAFVPRAEPATAAPVITSLTPSTAVATTLTLTIEGAGFDSASVLEVYDPKDHLLAPGTVTSRSASRIVATVSLAGAGPGTYTVRVLNTQGRRSKGMALTLTLGVAVTVSPRSGPPGTTFTYTGQGFTAGFGAISRLRRPDGREFPAKRMPVGADGRFQDVIWSGEFVPGTYTVWAADDYAKVASPPATFVVVP